ncbi:MAG: right-handed parallel beta-helix repeat-containing protein [Kiritimatiellia bacterium]
MSRFFPWAEAGLLALLLGVAQAADYFVAPDGNDANPGTLEHPWRDPVAAAARLMPGDTLYFRKGRYKCRTNSIIGLAPSRDGEEGKPITFRNYNDEHVVIDVAGADWGLSNNGFSYIVFDGFEVTGGTTTYNMKISAHHGRTKSGTGHHVTVRNCEIHHSHNENLFAAGTPYLVIENCHLHHSSRSHGIYLQVGCHNSVIRNVTSEHNYGNSGIQLNAAGGGITNVLVERCLLRYTAHGLSLMGVVNSVFRGNVLFSNGYDGPRGSGRRELIMWTYSEGGRPGTICQGILFKNNTFVNLVPAGHIMNHIVNSKVGTKNVLFRNNIFYIRGKPIFSLESCEGFIFEHNCLFPSQGGVEVAPASTLAEFAAAHGLRQIGTLSCDPAFVALENGDLKLTPQSPCRDAGVSRAVPGRVGGKAPDLGAYEYGVDVHIGCYLPWKKSQ